MLMNYNKLGKILKSVAFINKNIIFPVHPRTKKVIEKNDIRLPSNIKLINPLDTLDFIHLESNSEIIITDSGGDSKRSIHSQKTMHYFKARNRMARDCKIWLEQID